MFGYMYGYGLGSAQLKIVEAKESNRLEEESWVLGYCQLHRLTCSTTLMMR